ncbi:hypothetical protein BM1374165_01251 [Bartonella henselae]|uniref:Uncharacterized protein n=1 Tax=Bartonella henselae TaxID=38323 RepID=X5MG82_BARHN|nr:hypothetical protein BM1374165_01251 [Bartonella henselae]
MIGAPIGTEPFYGYGIMVSNGSTFKMQEALSTFIQTPLAYLVMTTMKIS